MQNILRVYHFTKKQYAIQDIEKRRLKVAQINELNDPYELLAPRFSDETLRATWESYRTHLQNIFGFLCFNCKWNNPVHWSHYAENHSGVCLGFDVDTSACHEIAYSNDRLDVELPLIPPTDPQEFMKLIMPIMTTKYIGWNYEKERRMIVFINQMNKEGGLYFQSFRDIMALKEVIIGIKCDLSFGDINTKLGAIQNDVKIYKARLSTQTYEIEREP